MLAGTFRSPAGATTFCCLHSVLSTWRKQGRSALDALEAVFAGEITIMGKVLPVGGIQQKVRASYDAGVKEVILPVDNLTETQTLPRYIVDAVTLTPVQSIDEVLRHALLPATRS